MHIQSHSQSCKQEGKRRPLLLFWKMEKKCLDFGKKGHDCVHIWVKLVIDNIVLRISRGKNFKMFPCRVLFPCAFDKMFIKVT